MTGRASPVDAEIFERDGVVLVKDAVSTEWLEALDEVLERIVRTPGRWSSDTGDQGADNGRALDVRYLWRDEPDIRRFASESGLSRLVGEALGCETLRFYYDHWFVKEKGRSTATPWHQDGPYWPVRGRQIASSWVALTDVGRESSGLEIVKGSHRWKQRFRARRFVVSDPSDAWIESGDDPSLDELPDIDAERDRHELFCEPMRRGDALIFSAWVVHQAPPNRALSRRAALSLRWLGDDVRWDPRPGTDPTVGPEHVALSPGDPVEDDDRFPIAWTRKDESMKETI